MKKDFLIVGQGLVGTVLAYELENRGIRPIVVDNSHQNSASKVAAGLFNPFVFKWITKSWMADEVMPVLRETYRGIEKKLGGAYLHQTGIVRVIGSEKEKESWARKGQRPDFATHIAKPDQQLMDSGRDRGFGNVTIKTAGWLDIPQMISDYRAFLESEGRLREEIFDHSLIEPAAAPQYKGERFDQIFFCEGAGVDQNPFFNHLNFRHTKGEVLDVEADDIHLEKCLNYGQFIVPRQNGRFRTGTTYNWEQLDGVPTEEGKEKILRNHRAFFESEPRVYAHRAGVRPTSADRRPFVGKHPEYSGLAILNATGSKGVLLAPWSARQLLDHVLFDTPLHPEIMLGRAI